MKRIRLTTYLYLSISILLLPFTVFFIAAAFKTEPFDYFGEKYIDAISEINMDGEGKGRVVVVKDVTNGDIKEGNYIVTTREFEQGMLYTVEKIIEINGTNGQIHSSYTAVFEAYITVSDIEYVFLRDANMFETTLYLLEKPERAIIFSVVFLSINAMFIYLTVIGFIKKKEKHI